MPPSLSMRKTLSRARDAGSVPPMGQIHFRAARLDEARRITGTEFALGVDVELVKNAVADARRERATAEVAAYLVLDQAVRALQDAGLTVREVADALAMSKSEVGRRMKRPAPAVIDYPPDVAGRIAAVVDRVWSSARAGR
jgi:hypothetical protein